MKKEKIFKWGKILLETTEDKSYGAMVTLFGVNTLRINLSWWFSISISVYLDIVQKKKFKELRLGGFFTGGYLMVDIFESNQIKSTIFLNVWELITGKGIFNERMLEHDICEITMPEGRYPAKYEIKRITVDYPRWMVRRQTDYMRIILDKGVPVPLASNPHGEAYDMVTTSKSSIDYDSENFKVYRAIESFEMFILNTRQRLVSLDWRPTDPEVDDIIKEYKEIQPEAKASV